MSFHYGSPSSCITWEMKSGPVGTVVQRRSLAPNDIMIIIVNTCYTVPRTSLIPWNVLRNGKSNTKFETWSKTELKFYTRKWGRDRDRAKWRGLVNTVKKYFGFHIKQGISWPAEGILTYQKNLRPSLKLTKYIFVKSSNKDYVGWNLQSSLLQWDFDTQKR
jgi:hypothetical protein